MICREYHIKGANIRTRTVERILWKIVLWMNNLSH
jgi:hypothetical protein